MRDTIEEWNEKMKKVREILGPLCPWLSPGLHAVIGVVGEDPTFCCGVLNNEPFQALAHNDYCALMTYDEVMAIEALEGDVE